MMLINSAEIRKDHKKQTKPTFGVHELSDFDNKGLPIH